MVPITQLTHTAAEKILRPGDLAIDATMGNGHDTLFLAQQVGPTGHIWGFDVQSAAINNTRTRLADNACSHVTLFQANHAQLRDLIPTEFHQKIAVITFNLGYLPGADHALVTRPAETLAALAAAISLLRPGGLLTVVTYRGHSGGEEEARAVDTWVESLPGSNFEIHRTPATTPQRGPQLLAICKQSRKDSE